MRRLRYLNLPLFAVLLTCAATGAWAQTKIGYVDWEEILRNAPQIGTAKAKLEAEFSDQNAAIERQEQNLRELEERLVRDAAVMSDEQRQLLERTVRNQRRDVQREKEDLREEIDFSLQEERQRVEQEIYEIVRQFAQAEGYDLIIPGPALFASNQVNLTEQLLERLRKSSPEDAPQ